ncbi:MAG TPA: hypothetical protein DEB44_00625 [Acidimicrobiaceae bacterium]|nr:hypothetical protein [Acidimicrobiaceae bacterium]
MTSECLELGVSAAFKWDVIGPVGTLSMLAPESAVETPQVNNYFRVASEAFERRKTAAIKLQVASQTVGV